MGLAQATCSSSDMGSPCALQDPYPHSNTRLGKGIRHTLERSGPDRGHLTQAGEVGVVVREGFLEEEMPELSLKGYRGIF